MNVVDKVVNVTDDRNVGTGGRVLPQYKKCVVKIRLTDNCQLIVVCKTGETEGM